MAQRRRGGHGAGARADPRAPGRGVPAQRSAADVVLLALPAVRCKRARRYGGASRRKVRAVSLSAGYLRPDSDVCADLLLLRAIDDRHGIADAEGAERDGVVYLHPSEARSFEDDRSIRLRPRIEPPTVDVPGTAGQ